MPQVNEAGRSPSRREHFEMQFAPAQEEFEPLVAPARAPA